MTSHYLVSVDHRRLRIFAALPSASPATALHRVKSVFLTEATSEVEEWNENPRVESAQVATTAREVARLIADFLAEEADSTWDFVADYELYALVLTFVDAKFALRLRQASVRKPIGRAYVDRLPVSLHHASA